METFYITKQVTNRQNCTSFGKDNPALNRDKWVAVSPPLGQGSPMKKGT